MKLSVCSRGWVWTALLLLAASCAAQAADNGTVTGSPVENGNDTSSDNTSVSPTKAKEPTSTVPVPKPSSTSTATSPTPATTTASVTDRTTAITKAPVITNATVTTATTKAPVKTTSANATTTISPVTSSISASLQKKSGFDLGSFMGGIVLTLCFFASVYFGCRFYNSKRGVRYRTIDEHEAII